MRNVLAGLLLLFASVFCVAANSEDVIMQADRDFSRNFNQATLQNRADVWLSYFSLEEAAVPLPPTAGKEAMTKRYHEMFSDASVTLKWEPINGEMFASGKMGYTTGKFVMRFKDDDGRMKESTGRYITVWRKQKDGSWKIVTDTGSSDGPPQEIKS